jgi:hypothetical protein
MTSISGPGAHSLRPLTIGRGNRRTIFYDGSPPRKKRLVSEAQVEGRGSKNKSNRYLALSAFATQIKNRVDKGTIRNAEKVSVTIDADVA